jgi:hypothetical protein
VLLIKSVYVIVSRQNFSTPHWSLTMNRFTPPQGRATHHLSPASGLITRLAKRLSVWSALLACLFISNANAAVLQISSGILTGATGVVVNSQTYNVVFRDGTCESVFAGCDAVSDFVFQTQASALAASQALLDQVFLDGVSGQFDSNPALTAGCASSSVCNAFTPFGPRVYSPNWPVTVAFNWAVFFAPDFTSLGSFIPANNTDFSSDQQSVWAVWSIPVSTSVPEPGTLATLGAGLLALVFARRRRT